MHQAIACYSLKERSPFSINCPSPLLAGVPRPPNLIPVSRKTSHPWQGYFIAGTYGCAETVQQAVEPFEGEKVDRGFQIWCCHRHSPFKCFTILGSLSARLTCHYIIIKDRDKYGESNSSVAVRRVVLWSRGSIWRWVDSDNILLIGATENGIIQQAYPTRAMVQKGLQIKRSWNSNWILTFFYNWKVIFICNTNICSWSIMLRCAFLRLFGLLNLFSIYLLLVWSGNNICSAIYLLRKTGQTFSLIFKRFHAICTNQHTH